MMKSRILRLGRSSRIIRVGPKCNHRCLNKRERQGKISLQMEERGVTDDLNKEGGGLEDGRRGPEPRNAGNATVEAGRGQVSNSPLGSLEDARLG